jgi:hypothetical protein
MIVNVRFSKKSGDRPVCRLYFRILNQNKNHREYIQLRRTFLTYFDFQIVGFSYLILLFKKGTIFINNYQNLNNTVR